MNILDTPLQTAILPNGLRVVFRPSLFGVTYCGFSVKAGTRDEEEGEEGIAHLVEHLIFKGTTHRRAWHVLNRMEAVGGELNAYTTKEETMVYSACLPQDINRAIDLLVDIVFRSTFPQREMEKEVEVVIDEIRSYEDSPSELIFDEFDNVIFKGHPLGKDILGEADQLRTYRTENILRFTQRYYKPSNMVFFAQGDLNFKRLIHTLERCMSNIPIGDVVKQPQPLPLYESSFDIKLKKTSQSHVILGGRAYDSHNAKRTGLYLLNNILGGPGMNSRLNLSLRERRGLVYTVESSLASYTDTGAYYIYFGTDAKNVNKCISLLTDELDKLCRQPLSSSQLAAAKKQLIGQISVASDNFENNALNMGKMYLHYNSCETLSDVCKRIDALTSIELLDVAKEVFENNEPSVLIYC